MLTFLSRAFLFGQLIEQETEDAPASSCPPDQETEMEQVAVLVVEPTVTEAVFVKSMLWKRFWIKSKMFWELSNIYQIKCNFKSRKILTIYLYRVSWFYSARLLTFDTTYWDETKTRKIRENIFFVLTVFNQNINCKQILMTWMFYWISSINYIQWPFIPCTCVNTCKKQ